MSSSQSANSSTISAGYAYDTDAIRDASDWIKTIREKSIYNGYKTLTNTSKSTTDPWLKYGVGFRLQYDFGRLKCQSGLTCSGNLLNGNVGDTIPTIVTGALILPNCSTTTFSCSTAGQFGTYSTSAVIAFQAIRSGIFTVTFSGISGALRRVLSTSTAGTYVTDTITSFSTGNTISLGYGEILYMMPAASNGETLTVNVC